MTKRKLILLVDDDEQCRNETQKILESAGHTVRVTGDTLDALDELLKGSFDLVITELVIPSMDGVELIREIGRRGIDVPVIFLTAHGEWESYLDLMNMGAFDYITKPVDEGEILSVVKRIPEACPL